jgi:hypothetical protein
MKQTFQMTKLHFSFQAFLAVLLVFVAHNTWSQKHTLDLKGGLSWCDQTGDFFNNTGPLVRGTYGLNYHFQFKNRMQIGAGLMQTQTGFNAPIVFVDINGNEIGAASTPTSYAFNYLSVPVRIGFQNGNKFFYYGNIGLSASFLTNAEITSPILNENLEVIGEDKFDLSDKVAPFELAGFLEVGGGYMLNAQLGVFAEGSFCQGFSSLTSTIFFADNTFYAYRTNLLLGLRYNFN